MCTHVMMHVHAICETILIIKLIKIYSCAPIIHRADIYVIRECAHRV